MDVGLATVRSNQMEAMEGSRIISPLLFFVAFA